MDVPALLCLAKQGCCERMVEISSSKLAEGLSVSQQTASRRIKELLDDGYIVREILPRGQKIKLTAKGLDYLRKMHLDLNTVFEEQKANVYHLTGKVTSGMGDGRYYMEIPKYKKQFAEKLGFAPYPGTLNLKLATAEDIRARRSLQDLAGIDIEGFSHQGRTFGSVKCFAASIEEVNGAVVIPARTHHGFDTIEAIAPEKIREIVGLRDGDTVTVKVFV